MIINWQESIKKTGCQIISKELFKLLSQTLQQDHNTLIDALNHSDAKEARRIIHKIKGGLSYCIVPEYSKQLQYLHNALVEETTDLTDILSNLQSAFDQLTKTLEKSI